MGGYAWDPEEIRILRRIFPTRGAKVTSESLARAGFERTKIAVRNMARGLDVAYNPEGCMGLIPLAHVHPDPRRNNSADKYAVTKAFADGVVTKARVYPHILLVPPAWADAYIEERADLEAQAAEAVRTWYTTPQAAKVFGVTAESLQTARNDRPDNRWALIDHVKRIETIRTRGLTVFGKRRYYRYWKPDDVHREAARYRKRPLHGVYASRRRAA